MNQLVSILFSGSQRFIIFPSFLSSNRYVFRITEAIGITLDCPVSQSDQFLCFFIIKTNTQPPPFNNAEKHTHKPSNLNPTLSNKITQKYKEDPRSKTTHRHVQILVFCLNLQRRNSMTPKRFSSERRKL